MVVNPNAVVPTANIIGVEPTGATDFQQSLAAGKRIRIDQPTSICDGLLSYDVGEHNWPILSRTIETSLGITDEETRQGMKWLYDNHGLKTEPSGAIATAAVLCGKAQLDGGVGGSDELAALLSDPAVGGNALCRELSPVEQRKEGVRSG